MIIENTLSSIGGFNMPRNNVHAVDSDHGPEAGSFETVKNVRRQEERTYRKMLRELIPNRQKRKELSINDW